VVGMTRQKIALAISWCTVGLLVGKAAGLADLWFYGGLTCGAGLWFLTQYPLPVEKPREATSGASPDNEVLRVYAVVCIAENAPRTGYRMTLCSGRSEDEAIGVAMRKLSELNPGWQLSVFGALEITPDRLAEIGVVVRRDGAPQVTEAA
jgi:hypothetical protein